MPVNVHIIGMNREDFPDAPVNFTFHGYLNKTIDNQRNKYYNLLSDAKLIINPNPVWAGYSSIIEAMYFFTPVIVTPFNQFKTEFGPSINFGKYCEPSSESVSSAIKGILNLSHKEYSAMSLNAHADVADYTWSNYVDKMLEYMEAVLKD